MAPGIIEAFPARFRWRLRRLIARLSTAGMLMGTKTTRIAAGHFGRVILAGSCAFRRSPVLHPPVQRALGCAAS
jgi:hypothetical protein